MIATIAAALEDRKDVEDVTVENDCEISVYLPNVGLYYTIEIDGADVDDDERGRGTVLKERKFPELIDDHVTLLDACLAALANSKHREKISDLTTDGDASDCEAIFEHDDEGDIILKVR